MIFHLLLFFMLFTGLQLYVHGLESGESSIGTWWPALLHISTDWTIAASGGTLMDVRIAHHITMWLIVVWMVFHIYYQIWRTIFWEEGDIAIVIGGSKFVKDGK
jgi:Ni/Fe-hydrogenase 1 B-type cytochrome subunit